jgi:hypothetical protein
MKRLLLAACLAGLALTPRASYAQISLGGQGSWGDRRDWAVGGRLTWDLSPRGTPLAFIGAFDWFFLQAPRTIDAEYWEVNVNVAFIQSVYRPEAVSYLGVGLNVATIKEERKADGEVLLDDTDYGVNLLGGTRYKLGRFAPFFELRYIIEGGEQFVVTAGLDLLLGTDY